MVIRACRSRPLCAISSSRSLPVALGTARNTRRFKSTGVKVGGVREEHLGPAEDRVTRRIEREVEPLDDPRLCLRVEVHQRVAAEEQVDPRNGRVLQQIVAAENHRPAQVAVHHEGAVDRIEILADHLFRHITDLTWRVGCGAGLRQRLLVRVGGVDLHAVSQRGRPDGFGEQHRQGIRFLPGGATGAPHTDRTIVFVRVEQDAG